VLGIHRLGRDAAGYYLADRGYELPVALGPSWVGGGATALGLDGSPVEAGLHQLLGRRHPLGWPLGSGRTAIAGYDLTFSAPKSASVLLALGGRAVAHGVLAAHVDAVAGALDYLERHAVTALRRRGAERLVLGTDGVVAVRFTHGVNRNGDPHLHSHVVMANLVHGEDGRWSACDGRGLHAHRAAASAVYEAGLRAGVTGALGVRWWGPPGHSPEVRGIPPQLLGEFSSRQADIRRYRHEAGVRGVGTRVAWAATRQPKGPARSFDMLTEDWRRRAGAAGPAPDVDRRCALGPGSVDEHRFAAVIALPAHGGAHRRDVVAAFAGGAVDGVRARALECLVDAWVPPGPNGVSEALHPRRAVVPAGHLLHALGPRPLDPAAHQVWLGAARAVEAYRDRWGLQRAPEPLGPGSAAALASFPVARLAEHARTGHLLESARARLGRHGPATPELALGLGR